MDRSEYQAWAMDFAKRFPKSGEWLFALPADTRNCWYDEIFAALELRDCLDFNRELMASGDLQAFQREHIPAIVRDGARKIRHERTKDDHKEREWQRKQRQRGGDTFATITNDEIMGPAFRNVTAKMQEWRNENGNERVPNDLIHQWTEEEFEKAQDDDERRQPRYKCLTCRDSGFVSFRDGKGRPMSGHCSCDKGSARATSWKNNRKQLGPAPSSVNPQWAFDD